MVGTSSINNLDLEWFDGKPSRVLDAIVPGTPLIRVSRLGDNFWVKAEHLLLTGSVFDRVALSLVSSVEPGLLIVAGAGSQCVAFAAAATYADRALVVVCPE